MLSSLSIFRSIGPALAIAVAVTLVAALTLVPAVVSLLGPGGVLAVQDVAREPEGQLGSRAIGRSVGRASGALRRSSRRGRSRSSPCARSASTRRSTSPRQLPNDAESADGAAHPAEGLPGRRHRPDAGAPARRPTASRLTAPALPAFAAKLETGAGVAQVGDGQARADGTTAAYTVVLDRRPRVRRGAGRRQGPAARRRARGRARGHRRRCVGGTTAVFADIQKAMATTTRSCSRSPRS